MSSPVYEREKKIALGTAQFGLDYGISNRHGQTSTMEAERILMTAFESGVELLDTAYNYGDSEKLLGNSKVAQKFKITSKFPRPDAKRSIAAYLGESLALLKRDSLYGYMAHDPQCIIDEPELWLELMSLRQKNLVSKIGFSLYTPDQLQRLLQTGCVPDIVQVPYNVLDRRFQSMFPRLKEIGTEIHARSVFLQGLFFLSPDVLPHHFENVKPSLQKIRSKFSDNENLAVGLLNFCVNDRYIDRVVIGVNNVLQLTKNLSGLNNSSPNFDWSDFSIQDESILLPYLWPKVMM